MKKLLSIALAALLLVSCASVLFVASAEATNVAPKATYEVHEWFRMGGQDVGWGYDASADISYPDSDHELTDGVLAEDCSYGTAAWIGLNQSHPDFKDTAKPLYIDFKLDQAYDVGTIRISLNNLNDAGIGAPVAVTAQASEDGEAVQGAYTAEPVAGEHCTYEITLNQNTAFVRLNFYSQACANNAVAAGNEPAWLAALADANKKNTWTFIDEVEIYDDGEAAAETIVETIDVDGDLDDTGWAEDGWVRVDGEEAIQGSPEGKEPQPFSIQLRTDDEWLYVGVIYEQPMTKGAAASASGSRLRMWFHNSDEYDRYTHFYDIWPDENGETCTLAKYNTAKDANSGAPLENSTVKGKITEKDGYTYFEFAVKYSEFLLEGQDTIRYFANMHNGLTPNTAMFYPTIPFETGDPYMPWTEWNSLYEGQLKIEDAKLGEKTVEPAKEDAYLWLSSANDVLPSITYKIPAETFQPGPLTIETRVFFGEDCTEDNGCVYLNLYPYSADDVLLNWVDYAKFPVLSTGEWHDVVVENHNPAKNDVEPASLWFGIGYYQATGTVKVAYIHVLQDGKQVWGVDFTDESVLDGATLAHIDEDNKDVNWGFVDPNAEPEPEPDPDEGYEEAIAAKVLQPVDGSIFKTELASEVDDEGNVTVTLTINGMKAEDKIIGFQIPVYFDAERLDAIVTDIKDEALNCVAEDGMPGSNWENLTAAKVVEKDGESYIYFQCGTAKTDYCDENTELVATFKFTLKEGFERAGIWTVNRNAKCFIDDGQMSTVYGEASYTIAEKVAVQPTPTPVTPTPTPTPSETPGDAGIIVFAVLGVLAVIGAAVVIKVRK